jgi:1-acyl-sn-glycerol-3-phosphate acyltransferase
VRVCQFITYWSFRASTGLYLRKRVIELERADIKRNKQYVLAANHQNNLDPFILISLLPPKVFKRMRTLRFFAHNVFFRNPINRAVMTSLGAFPTKEHPVLPHGLRYANDQLNEGHPVLIFPEGRMSVPRETPAKLGVEIMAQWRKVMIIPVHLEWDRYQRVLGGKLRIHIGKPFSGKGMSAQEILDRIYELEV